jgi:hypothetical protein
MPAWTDPERGSRVELFSESSVSADDAVALWTGEAGLREEVARRRVGELTHVATDRSGALIGMSTTFLAPYSPIDLPLWHFRAFISAAHRRSHLAIVFLAEGFLHLQEQAASGAIEGAGMLVVAEDEELQRGQPQAMWPRTRFAYVGDNIHGWPVRVRYFAGAAVSHRPERPVLPPGRTPPRRIVTTRGGLDDRRRRQILDLWSHHGVLGGDAAQERLTQVVAVLVDEYDSVVGVNSVYAEQVRSIGGRRFWVYRRYLEPGASDEDELAMLGAAYDALAAEHEAEPSGTIGVCAAVRGDGLLVRHPETEWPNHFLYAGYLPDGSQLRVRYFEGASIFQ